MSIDYIPTIIYNFFMSHTIKAVKYSLNPILTPVENQNRFDRASVYNPAVIVKNNSVYMIYRGEEDYYKRYVSRLGLAMSEDGYLFKRYSQSPVVTEDLSRNELYGCEDPRIISIDSNRYFLTYVANNGTHNIALCGAFSKNLTMFQKIGPIIPGKEKSGAIIQNYKYQDRYVMYFGEGNIKIAYSDDLIHWEIHKKPILTSRSHYFDSCLVEAGPPPIVTKKGILVIYNSAKKGKKFKGGNTWLSYSPGYAIFNTHNPSQLLYRSNTPILEPFENWEKFGKVNYVIFATGLIQFKNKYLLYYGGADKCIGVAELIIPNH